MSDRRRMRKLGLSAAAAIGAIAVPELALRAAGFAYPPLDAPIVVWNPVEDRKLAAEDSLHRGAVRQLWSLRPGAVVPEGAGERVNESGFRGPLRGEKRVEGFARVAWLGDSSAFGFGLPYEDTGPAQLERLLAEAGLRCEVLNLGVIGFSIRQGIERYRELARRFEPDVVVAAFGAVNEHHLSGGLDDETKIARSAERADRMWRTARWIRECSRLLHAAAWLVDLPRGGRDAIRRDLYRERLREVAAMERMGQVDCPGTPRVSLDQFEACLEVLRREVGADGARLILVSMPRRPSFERDTPILALYTERLARFASRAGVALLDARSAFQSDETPRGPEDELFLPGDPVHPSRAGQALIARGLSRLILVPEPARPGG